MNPRDEDDIEQARRFMAALARHHEQELIAQMLADFPGMTEEEARDHLKAGGGIQHVRVICSAGVHTNAREAAARFACCSPEQRDGRRARTRQDGAAKAKSILSLVECLKSKSGRTTAAWSG
jgi:hypothetical protein